MKETVEWLPIESAPKGELVRGHWQVPTLMLKLSNGSVVRGWYDNDPQCFKNQSRPCWNTDVHGRLDSVFAPKATHWAPWPSGPAVDSPKVDKKRFDEPVRREREWPELSYWAQVVSIDHQLGTTVLFTFDDGSEVVELNGRTIEERPSAKDRLRMYPGSYKRRR